MSNFGYIDFDISIRDEYYGREKNRRVKIGVSLQINQSEPHSFGEISFHSVMGKI